MPPKRIEADFDDLMIQAPMTAKRWLQQAILGIDEIICTSADHPKSIAHEHPELIVAFMNACAMDLASAIIAQQIRAGFDRLAEVIKDKGETKNYDE